MGVLDRIRKTRSHAMVRRCAQRNCRLVLDGLGNHVVLKGEFICKDRKICDCIIFVQNRHVIIAIAELKSRVAHSVEILEKLRNGSEIALDILEHCSQAHVEFEFYHIVLAKSWSTSEYRVITNRKIRVRGKKYSIIPKRCGCSLSDLISRLS